MTLITKEDIQMLSDEAFRELHKTVQEEYMRRKGFIDDNSYPLMDADEGYWDSST